MKNAFLWLMLVAPICALALGGCGGKTPPPATQGPAPAIADPMSFKPPQMPGINSTPEGPIAPDASGTAAPGASGTAVPATK